MARVDIVFESHAGHMIATTVTYSVGFEQHRIFSSDNKFEFIRVRSSK